MERCKPFAECNKHFVERGQNKQILRGKASVMITYMCTTCERRWQDQYAYQQTVDTSFVMNGNDPERDSTYGSVISDTVTD